MAYYCNGLKGICDCDILCADCKVYDGSGGKEIVSKGDKIRAMSDRELAAFICGVTKCEVCQFGTSSGCKVTEWLKQPAEEVNDDTT